MPCKLSVDFSLSSTPIFPKRYATILSTRLQAVPISIQVTESAMEDDFQRSEEPRTRTVSAGGGRNEQESSDDADNDSDDEDGGELAHLSSEPQKFNLETTQPEERTQKYVHGILLEVSTQMSMSLDAR